MQLTSLCSSSVSNESYDFLNISYSISSSPRTALLLLLVVVVVVV